METTQLYSVVINKATRKPYLIEAGLSFKDAVDSAISWGKHWSVLYKADVADPVVSFIVVNDGEHETFTSQTVLHRCGAV